MFFLLKKNTLKAIGEFNGRWLAWPGVQEFSSCNHTWKGKPELWKGQIIQLWKGNILHIIYIYMSYSCIHVYYIYIHMYSNPKKIFPGGLQLFSLRKGMLYNGLHIWNSIMCDFLCLDWDFVVLCFSDSPHLNFWGLWSHVWMDSGHDKQCCTFYLRWVTRGFALLYPPVW